MTSFYLTNHECKLRLVGPWDKAVFYWINGWPDGLDPLFQLMSQGNRWWSVRIFLGVLAVLLVSIKRTRVAAILSLCGWPLSNLITDVLKGTFQMGRPCVVLSDVHLRVELLTSYGTASAHAANMAAVATVFALYLGWKAWPAVLVAFLVGLSRIYVGVHFPSQVLLGWLVGALAGLIVAKTYEAYLKVRDRTATGDLPDASPAEES